MECALTYNIRCGVQLMHLLKGETTFLSSVFVKIKLTNWSDFILKFTIKFLILSFNWFLLLFMYNWKYQNPKILNNLIIIFQINATKFCWWNEYAKNLQIWTTTSTFPSGFAHNAPRWRLPRSRRNCYGHRLGSIYGPRLHPNCNSSRWTSYLKSNFKLFQ